MTRDPLAAPLEPDAPDVAADAPRPKAPAPDLATRAPPPAAVRLRRSVVQAIVLGGAVLVSGSLAWAFVVQPALREGARARAAEAREDPARGAVRPAELVTDQPASYDRLPEPRSGSRGGGDEAPGPEPVAGGAPEARPSREAGPAEPDPREVAARSGLFFADAGGAGAGPTGVRASAAGASGGITAASPVYNPHGLTAPLSPYELKAGAVIPAALLTAVDTARAGPVVAVVTQTIHDTVSGRHLLIPQGARLIGRHDGDSAYGDRRAFLTWDRLILPNGRSLIQSAEPGVDAQGAVGVEGAVDRRLGPLVVGTLFAGAITTLGQAARDGEEEGGLLGDAGDAAAIEGAQVGGRLIDRELQVRPSIRLRPGAPVRVLITRDLILEPYEP